MAVSISISITQNSQSIANNTSNVTAKVTASWTYGSYNLLQKSGWLKIDGTTYSFTNSFNDSRTTSGSKVLFTKTVNVSHNSNGSKTLYCSASYSSAVSSGTVTASASKVLTTIPRASSLTVGNGTLGTAQTLSIGRADSSFKHKITYTCGSVSGYAAGSSSDFTTSTSISWTPPLSLAKQNTTGTTVSITLCLKTYTSGGAQIGSATKTIRCSIPTSLKPTCSLSVTDSTGHSTTYGSPVQNLSKLKVVVTPTLSYGSPINSYKTSANGSTYTSASFTTGVIKSSGTQKISTTITDKRGRTGTASTSLSVLAYNTPSISKLFVSRCDADGTANDKGEYVKATFSASVSSLNNKNTATYTMKYRLAGTSTYTEIALDDYANTYSVVDQYCIFAADGASSYEIEFSVSDAHNTTARSTTVSTAFTLMHFHASGTGMGIGKISETIDLLDIGLETRFSGGLLHPILPAETDLNTVLTPNTYMGANVTDYNYGNCPIDSGTFSLEVIGMGSSGQVKQRLSECKKADARVYERVYYQSAFGDWFCVSDYAGTILWSGGMYMTSGHTITLSEAISKQPNGVVLVFSEYSDGAVANWSFHARFIPKKLVATHSGSGHCFQMSSSNLAYFATKYLYISDTKIVGHNNNGLTGTSDCGIKYTNNRFVLRYVIGV